VSADSLLAGREALPGLNLGWVREIREQGAARFRAAGLPTRRNEAWHYTDLRPLGQAGYEPPQTVADEALRLPRAHTAKRVLFVDGRLRHDLSSASITSSVAMSLHKIQGRIAVHEEPMAALNAALFEDGLVFSLPEGMDAGLLEVAHVAAANARPFAVHPRHLVRLAAGAKLTLLEVSAGAGTRYLHNAVWQVEVGPGARFTHVRLQQEGAAGTQICTVYAEVAEGGVYDSFTLNAGGRLVRSEAHVVLAGSGAAAHLNAAQMVGEGQHCDTTTFLDHAAPGCQSRQTCKTVLNGRSRGVFQGRILVRQAAQQTDGYQMNQALLLSADAEMDSKPQLEIYADDVKCSHGATVGALDADQLFYLCARGIPQAEARGMLVRAFLHEAVEGVTDETCRAALDAAVDAWWEAQR
jgi:Fe-S cluster assembly protein SufD